jgi:D-glycero-D-manno-heptose 1,7-bisphosphate phosphatase
MKVDKIDFSRYNTLFLDRDGVINKLLPGDYVKSWDEFKFIPGMLEKLAEWRKEFKYILIVTNQRGVGREIMSEEVLLEIHSKMLKEIENSGGGIDKIYYCTDLEETAFCRKPNIGMFKKAIKDFPEIDVSKSIMIGDSDSDMMFARNSGMRGIKI